MTTPDNGFAEITHRELGLRRQLTCGQMSMIAIGGAIGTGLFMGSAYAIGYAGPSVLLSYAIGALITLILMGCLAEMTVAHFMIFLTHLFFRRYRKRHGRPTLSFELRLFPYSTLLGLVLMGAVMITTYFTDAFRMTLVFGVPFLLILSAVYYGFFRKGRARASNKALV